MRTKKNNWMRMILVLGLVLLLAMPVALEMSFLIPDSMSEVLGAEAETIQMESTLGAGSEHELDLAVTTSYNLTVDITAQSLSQPVLEIVIPEGIKLTYYPDQSDTTLANALATVSNPVTRTTGNDNSTVLTYYFKANIAAVGFNITLNPTYNLQPDNDYTVSAALSDGTSGQAATADTITIVNNPTLNSGTYKVYGYSENIILQENADYYQARMYGRIYANYADPYDYDEMEIVLPLPDDAQPGYYDGDDFVMLSEDVPKSFDKGSVTYKTGYDILDINGTELGSGKKVLVYTLDAEHPIVQSAYQTSYYYEDTRLGAIYLRFPGTMSQGIYYAAASARVGVYVDNDTDNLLVLSDHTTANKIGYYFKEYNIRDFLYQYLYHYYAEADSANNVLNIEDNNYFYNYITNTTGETIEDLRVEYNIPAELHCYKLDFRLTADANNHLPTTAFVQYRSKMDEDTLRTATMTADDSFLTLQDEADSFTYLDVVYDKLDSSNYSNSLLYAYIVNRENVDTGTTPYRLSSQIMSALPTGSISDISIGEQNIYYYSMYLRQKYDVFSPDRYYLSSNVLNKGDTFNVYF